MIPEQAPVLPPGVVLDTNAVLDWLVFANDNMLALGAAIQSGQVLWRTSPRMREELSRTLTYPALACWKPDSERTLTFLDRWSVAHADPARTTSGPLVCSDSDDQVFMDLALATRARWLITHDRALLKLGRAAGTRGTSVIQPSRWSLPVTEP